MVKNCIRCGGEHALVGAYCSDCFRPISAAVRAKRKANGKARAYYLQRRESYWEAMLQRVYGLTVADYNALLERQGGGCAICGQPRNSHRLAVDHDHATGRVRGLLCAPCNHAIGSLRDRPDLLRSAIAYLAG